MLTKEKIRLNEDATSFLEWVFSTFGSRVLQLFSRGDSRAVNHKNAFHVVKWENVGRTSGESDQRRRILVSHKSSVECEIKSQATCYTLSVFTYITQTVLNAVQGEFYILYLFIFLNFAHFSERNLTALNAHHVHTSPKDTTMGSFLGKFSRLAVFFERAVESHGVAD